MKIKNLVRRVIMSAAALCLAAAMTVTSFAANPDNLPVGGQEQQQEQGQQGQQAPSPSYAPDSDSYMTIHFFYLSNSGAAGKMADEKAQKFGTYTLPQCTFTAPKGMEFAGWVTNDYISQPGSTIQLDSRNDYYCLRVLYR